MTKSDIQSVGCNLTLWSSKMGIVNMIGFLAVSLAAAKTSQFIRATFNAQYYKVDVGICGLSHEM